MGTAYAFIQARRARSELPEKYLSRYTVRPGSLGLTLVVVSAEQNPQELLGDRRNELRLCFWDLHSLLED